MVILQVYTKSIKTKYKSTLLSKSTFVTVIFGIFTIIGPFVFAYKTKGFWLKHDTFYEHPDVRFKGEYLITATTDKMETSIICCTYPKYQQYTNSLDACSSIKVREIDKDYDGKVDELQLSLKIVLPERLRITSLNVIIPLDYRLHKSCPLHMQSAIVFQHYFVTSASELSVYGDLAISQTNPLICHRKVRHSLYNYSIIANENEPNNYKFENIIEEYMKRNLTTHLNNIYTNSLLGSTEELKISFKVRYPEHKFYYQPGFWQIMKHAWVQYYAVYIIVAWIVYQIKNYIFTNRLVLFYEDCPIKKND